MWTSGKCSCIQILNFSFAHILIDLRLLDMCHRHTGMTVYLPKFTEMPRKDEAFFCPLLVFLNFTCCEYNISVNLVYSQASTPLESGHVKGRKSLVGAAAFPDLCKTLEGPVQASGFLFWSKVQLSLWLWPVKSVSYCIKRSLCGPSGR